MFRHLIFVWSILMVIVFPVRGQQILPNFKHLTISDGLPSSTTYFVIQDSKGYMWFTTDHGVARYNGYEFKVFTTRDGLEDNTVFYMYEDVKGRIWMLTFSGKIFYYLNGKIYPYKFNKASVDFVKGTAPVRIYVDDSDNVYITCRGELKINDLGKTIVLNKINATQNCNVLIHEISDSCILSSSLYSIKTGTPLSIFYKNNSVVDSIFTLPYRFARANAVRFNHEDLFFTIGNDFYLFRKGNVIHLSKGPFTEIYFMLKDKSNRLYVCTDNGLYIYDDVISSNLFEVYFEGMIVTSCCIDRENGFWVTTRDNGVYYLSDFSLRHFEIKNENYEKVVCLTSDLKNSVYAAYSSGLVTQISGTVERTIYTFPTDKKVYNLFLDESRKLIIGGDSSGSLFQNTFRPFVNNLFGQHTYTHLKNNFVRHGGFLFSGAQSAIIKIANDSIAEHVDCNQRINCLYETKQHQLLLGCINGVLMFNDSAKKATLYQSSLSNMSIQDIKQSHSYTCFATQGKGLVLFDGKNTISITQINGLASDFVSKVLVQGNDIWCATNLGISHIHFNDPKNLRYNITNITIKEGLTDNEINDMAFLNDTIWVATNSGICFFNIKHDFKNAVEPFVYITAIQINGSDTSVQKNYSLPHDFNNLKISFRGISYKSQKEIKYRYVLKTNGDSVFGITKNTEIEFLALSAGNYSFYVEAQNSSETWSRNAATFSFIIYPVWWQTWWFRVIMISLIIALGFLFYKNRLKKLNEKFDAERTQAILQLTASRAQMNPHFIFNVMNSIRNYIQKSDTDSAQKYLTSFAKLIRYMLDNSEVQEISLREELNALTIYAELEKQRFENAFDFNIICEDAIDLDETMVPSLLLQPFVENSIKHGIAKIETKGIILITIKKSGDKILIAIEDNGAGREQINAGINDNHNPHGTTITLNRITAYNTAYNKNIKAQTFDLIDENQKPKGTKVEILI